VTAPAPTPSRLRGSLLPRRVAPGQAQMDLDGALLRWAAAAPDRLAVRTYGWSRPTLSLGRIEPWPEGWDLEAIARAGLDVARRPTGGDAVLHDEEATFAIAASVPGPWAEAPRAFSERVADAVAEAYRTLDLAAERVPASERAPAQRAGASPCFARTAPGEVRVGAFKLAGIASKFTRGGALSHASLPLTGRHRDVAAFRHDAARAADLLAGHARGAGELLGGEISAELVEARLLAAIGRVFGVALVETPFSALGIADPAPDGAPASRHRDAPRAL
jgi:lipoate-protein ligase A